MRNGFPHNDRTVHDGLALPRWAVLTARNAELLAYLQRDEAIRTSRVGRHRMPFPVTRSPNSKEK